MHISTRVFIYGAGRLGTAFYRFCKDAFEGTKVAFLETNPMQARTIDGIAVFSPEEVCRNADDVLIFLAIGNPTARRMVRLKLLSYHIPPEHIIDAADFIQKNDLEKGKTGYCVLCDEYVAFRPGAPVTGGIFDQYHIIGGGWRKNHQCPHCGGVDRIRWIYYVLCNHTQIFERPSHILHFAPESVLSQRILEAQPASAYFPADISPGSGVCRIDMTHIPFSDETFDYVIANHVLEHIVEEERAVSELMRVLKPDGKIVLSFPICVNKDTYENSSIVTPEERLRVYGQKDHVRLYGSDYKERLESYGLKITVHTPQEELTMEEVKRLGFIPDDVTLLCQK